MSDQLTLFIRDWKGPLDNLDSYVKERIGQLPSYIGEFIISVDRRADFNPGSVSVPIKLIETSQKTPGAVTNEAISASSNEWVFVMDWRDSLETNVLEAINSIVSSGKEVSAIRLPIKRYLGKHWLKNGGMYPQLEIRCCRKAGVRFDDADEVEPSVDIEGQNVTLHVSVKQQTYENFNAVVDQLDEITTREAKKWYRLNKKVSVLGSVVRMLGIIFKRYVLQAGFKDGVPGLYIAVNSGMRPYLSFLKYRELRVGAAPVPQRN